MCLDLYKYDLLLQALLREQVYLKTIVSCRYVEGGMGSVSLAIGNAAREHGAHVVTSAEVLYVRNHSYKLSNFEKFVCVFQIN
jgi:hypothetical protein